MTSSHAARLGTHDQKGHHPFWLTLQCGCAGHRGNWWDQLRGHPVDTHNELLPQPFEAHLLQLIGFNPLQAFCSRHKKSSRRQENKCKPSPFPLSVSVSVCLFVCLTASLCLSESSSATPGPPPHRHYRFFCSLLSLVPSRVPAFKVKLGQGRCLLTRSPHDECAAKLFFLRQNRFSCPNTECGTRS